MEIQTLKSIIADLWKQLQGPTAMMMEIPVIPSETDLRVEEQQKEINKLKVELAEVINQLNYKIQELESKEKVESSKYKNNVDKLKRLMEENNGFLTNLKKEYNKS